MTSMTVQPNVVRMVPRIGTGYFTEPAIKVMYPGRARALAGVLVALGSFWASVAVALYYLV